MAEIACRADLRPNQIYRWRREMEQAAQGYAEVQVQPDSVPVMGSAIIVEFERAIVRIPAGASPGLVWAVLRSVNPRTPTPRHRKDQLHVGGIDLLVPGNTCGSACKKDPVSGVIGV